MMTMRKPIFTVSHASARRSDRTVRPDINMTEQLRESAYNRDVALHQANWADYKGTCETQRHHEIFLLSLLGEAQRYQFGGSRKPLTEEDILCKELLRQRLAKISVHTQKLLKKSDAKYPEALSSIASHKLFAPREELY